MANEKGIVQELGIFLQELRDYYNYRANTNWTNIVSQRVVDLRRTLVRKSGKHKRLIAEVTGIDSVPIIIDNKEYVTDIWSVGLLGNPVKRTPTALGYCIDSVGQAIGKLEDDIKAGQRDARTGGILTKSGISGSEPLEVLTAKANWKSIESEFGITKMGFGKRINFITDPFKRTIIFRDVEQAFILASSGFSKPSVILAGSVIEELLRLYLECKNISPLSENFDGYIRTCEQHGLLKDSVSRLSHSVRQFRNLVHLSAEKTKKHTISKATAKGAVSSIFTIANDF